MVMMILCGLSLVYFIILQPLMNFYSLLLYLEKPPGEIKEQYGSVFANWSSESLERLTNNTFVFSLGQFANVLESFEYPWSFDRTVMVLSGLLNVCQFVLLLREMAFNRRFASLCCPEICGASSEALAKSTPSRSRKSKTTKAAAAATAPPTAASQAEATAPPQSSSAKVAADNITSPASKANKAAPPSSHTGHCCCCNHSNHPDSHSDSGNESNDGEPISASVAGCKKVTRKTTRAADDGTGPTSTQGAPSGQGGDEVTTTRSFSPGELREMRKDFSRREGENILTWLLRCWDNGAETIELEGGEARQLGSLSRDSTIDRAISRESNATTLWTRLLAAMKVRFPYKEDCISKLGKWNTMERGIQFLRELAVREIIYFGPNSQEGTDPDRINCTRPLWRRFVQSAPPAYAKSLAGMVWSAGGVQEINEVIEQLRNFEDSLAGSLRACVSAVEKLCEKSDDRFEKLLQEIKELREDTYHSRPAQTYVSAIRKRRFQSRERGQRQPTKRGSLWFFLHEQGENMNKWHGRPTSELQERVREIKGKTPRKVAAPVYKRSRRDSDALEGTSNSHPETVQNRN